MLIALVIAQPILLIAAFAGVLVYIDRRDSAATELARDAIGALERERDKDRLEVQQLLQRIQAPDLAVGEHQAQVFGKPAAAYALSDEEQVEVQDAALAEQLQAAVAEIERLENQPFEGLVT